MATERRSALTAQVCIDDLALQINAAACVHATLAEDAKDRAAPPRTCRASCKIIVPVELSDVLYNGVCGLRAHYWTSPECGDQATRCLIRALTSKLLAALPDTLQSVRGIRCLAST